MPGPPNLGELPTPAPVLSGIPNGRRTHTLRPISPAGWRCAIVRPNSDPRSRLEQIAPEAAAVVNRQGARLVVRALGRALTELEARTASLEYLAEGERILQCVERDGTQALSYTFTFVVWPKTSSHTSRMLDDLRSAA